MLKFNLKNIKNVRIRGLFALRNKLARPNLKGLSANKSLTLKWLQNKMPRKWNSKRKIKLLSIQRK